MKAVIYRRYGQPEVLQLAEIDKPAPKDNELLIKVHAAEVTKSDCEMRSFRFPVKWFWLPLRLAMGLLRPRRPVLGGYFSGEVEAVGAAVTRFKTGDPVFGTTRLRLGAYGEYVCLPEDFTIVPKPRNTSFAEAAAVPLGGLNALHFMRRANIQPGEQVLVNGAGGSIGCFGIQIAKSLGAEVAAVDAAHKELMLRRIGADHFIDYKNEEFAQAGRSYDVVFNMVAGAPFNKCMGVLKPGGRYLTANPRLSDMVRSARVSRSGNRTAIFAFARETVEELLALKAMIEAGEIRPVVDRVYPLEQAAEAQRRVESEQRLGSIVLAVTGTAANCVLPRPVLSDDPPEHL